MKALLPCTLALSLTALALSLVAAEPAGEAPKTHRLFMGTTLAIVSQDALLPVKDVRQNSFVVSGPRGDLVVRADDRQFKLKINEALQLTTTFATIDKLSFDRTYTPENDPMKKFVNAAQVAAYMNDSSDAANGALQRAGVSVGVNAGQLDAANKLEAASPSEGAALAVQQSAALLASANAQQNAAQMDASVAQVQTGMDAFSTTSASSRMSSDIAAEQFDALTVTFKISAPRPLDTPHVVIFMRFLRDKDHPETATTWVYAEKLPDIDVHPRKITIQRGGFPPGYHIDSYQVHLYEGPTEIATTVSRKRVDLTTAEAFQYSVIDYIGSHRNETRGPAKAAAFWPTDLSNRLLPDKLTRHLCVKVDKAGQALGIFEDESCTRPVADAEIAALAPELRFLPALEKGKPVEGVIMVALGPRS